MSSNKYWYNSQYNMHEKRVFTGHNNCCFQLSAYTSEKCASLANQDRKKLQDKPIIANVGTKKVYFQQKAWVYVNMRPVLYNSMFEFIINDGQDSTTLNWRSLFRKIAYRASKKITHSDCSQKIENFHENCFNIWWTQKTCFWQERYNKGIVGCFPSTRQTSKPLEFADWVTQ